MRSVLAGVFPMVVGPLFRNVGTGPGSSITGGGAAFLIPVPFFFYAYGKRIRQASKWSQDPVSDYYNVLIKRDL